MDRTGLMKFFGLNKSRELCDKFNDYQLLQNGSVSLKVHPFCEQSYVIHCIGNLTEVKSLC
jgi:hypothetical protein